ncbi:FmdB family zinc ribbon protein [Piscinibacter sp.]|jgi:putative FmdB family regulatory protein|uniref:FmdB family zinc ribbon protein n=1 Tax=Piscinibacter sp. TaxID=1903157 RepID=UPI0035595F67
MPLYDYHCSACQAAFELLIRSSTPPVCPHCGSTQLQRGVSLTAPQGKSAGIVASARRQAAREGHFSNYQAAERAKTR